MPQGKAPHGSASSWSDEGTPRFWHRARLLLACFIKRMRTSPKDTPCLYCGRMFTKKGAAEHERHACKKNPNRCKRSFGKKKCKYCGKAYHAAGLRAHVATQHPAEFAKEEVRRKPSSRAAQRRELAAKLSAPAAKVPPAKLSAKRHSVAHPSPPKSPRSQESKGHSSSHGAASRAWSRMETKMAKAAAT